VDQQSFLRKRLEYFGNILTFTKRLSFTLGSVKNYQVILKKDFQKGETMNEILDYLMLISILGLSSLWVCCVFCYMVFLLGGYDE